jgi:hypothetical protein
MQYIMVPVPEEHAAAVAHYLQWNVGQVGYDGWEPDEVVAFLRALPDASRALLLKVAAAADEVVTLSVIEGAQVAGCSEYEVLGLMMELNEAIGLAGGPPFSVATEVRPDATESGPRSWTLKMPGSVATMFLDGATRGSIPRF